MTHPLSTEEAMEVEPGDKLYVMFDKLAKEVNETVFIGCVEGFDKRGNIVYRNDFINKIDYTGKRPVRDIYMYNLNGLERYHHCTISRKEGLYSTFTEQDFLIDGYRKDLHETILPEICPNDSFKDIRIDRYLEWLSVGMSFFKPTIENINDMIERSDIEIDEIEDWEFEEESEFNTLDEINEEFIQDELDEFETLPPQDQIYIFEKEYGQLKGTYNLITYIRDNFPKEVYGEIFYHPETLGDIINKFRRKEIDTNSIMYFSEFHPEIREPFDTIINNYIAKRKKENITRS
ncbi:MAG: hypothetical protein ACOCU6_03245 [Nanoarchaeota archaeon]